MFKSKFFDKQKLVNNYYIMFIGFENNVILNEKFFENIVIVVQLKRGLFGYFGEFF